MPDHIRLASAEPVVRPIRPAVEKLNDIAVSLYHAKQWATAVVYTRRALAIEPRCGAMWGNLGANLLNLHRFDEAIEALERALELEPDNAVNIGNIGLVHAGLGNLAEAERWYSRALDIRPDYLDAAWNRSVARIGAGKYEAGWGTYDTRIARGRQLSYLKFPFPEWQGEDLSNKRIWVASEQGIGDVILFSRFLPWLASLSRKKPYLCVSATAIALLWEFRDLVEFVPENVPFPEADYQVWMGSLPRHYGATLGNLPSDPGLIAKRCAGPSYKIQAPRPPGFEALRVGICWTGNPNMDRNHERTIPFPLLLELAENPHVWLYSLQAGPASDEIARLHAQELVLNLGPEMLAGGLPSAGAVLAKMDLVITCCTSIAHLASAAGVPTWVLLCADPYWVWGTDERSAWWPKTRLFRQRKMDEWRPVIDEVKSALKEFRHG